MQLHIKANNCSYIVSTRRAMEKLKNFFWGVWFCIVLCLAFSEAAPKNSLITYLPGFNGTFPSKHYSGYISLNEKNLFYYFIVSERNLLKDAVVLWLNGGPGCSSFDGFVYEHVQVHMTEFAGKVVIGDDIPMPVIHCFEDMHAGPFNFEEGSSGGLPKLHLNPYRWSKVSNIIYLDSPCGVGMSYSNNKTNYIIGDFETATDSHHFLLKWFEQYSEFNSNPFYIAGESYAGVYVPTLAYQVAKGIKAGEKPIINLKGYLVGNGVSNTDYDGINALVPFTHGMGLISQDIYQDIQSSCKGNYSSETRKCVDSIEKMDRGLNIYDILEPCYHDPSSNLGSKGNNRSLPVSFQQLGATQRPLKVRKRMFGRAWPLWALHKDGHFPHSWPQLADHGGVYCVNDEIATAWLNDESVRKAIHAEPKTVAGPWELCSDRIDYQFGADSMLPYHINLTAVGYRALIYSGDHDMCVPFTGTQAWTRSLGYNVVDEWRSWLSNQQVAGYLQGYDKNLTFLTIKGAGHTVPEYKPQESLDFYTRWLDGKPI